MQITTLGMPIECDATAFTRLSPEEQADFLRRCNADPALTELEEESKRRWSRSERRYLIAFLLGGLAFSYFIVSYPLGLFAVVLLGWFAAWYAAEWWMWYPWYKPRWSEAASKVVLRELEQLPRLAETNSKPTE
jgi:hypothetical protein